MLIKWKDLYPLLTGDKTGNPEKNQQALTAG
jgi:hypothetical protein